MKNMMIPTDAPAVINCDQGEIKSKAFGGPSFIVKANSGPNIRVKIVNACTDLANLGNILRTISPLA